MRKRLVAIMAVVTVFALFPGTADAHTGGKVSALSWQDSGNPSGFGTTVKVWNHSARHRTVRVTVEVEGNYTVTTTVTECEPYIGCYSYEDYDYGTVIRRVRTKFRLRPFGTARRRLRGGWTLPAGAELDYVFSDVVHTH